MQINKNQASLLKSVLPVAVSLSLCTAIVFITLVLPLCYGIDLTGLGERLKLKTESLAKPANGIAAYKTWIETQNTATRGINEQPGAPDNSGEIQEPHQESVHLTVPAKQNLSFRFFMERDYDLAYNWATDGKPLYCELRGENPVVTAKSEKVFGKLTESRAKGFFISPFTGNYTFYWENKTDKPVSIRLTAKGVFNPLG